ncbi:MAG: VCBS repeat-containing protein [Planctomycetes bacterium]|nr:VCBS repeat-containing protein [Planctomycetota bacterium]
MTSLLSAGTHAQQFIEESASRFPSPNPTEYTNQLTIGDIDGDGDLDLIFANGGNFSSPGAPQPQRVYINNGSGVFTDESAARLGFSGLCRGVELGDIDDDGDLDLIFAQDFNRLPHLFTNNGNGFFTDVTAAQLPNITLSSSRAQFGDVDNDGDLDIYITSGGSTNRFGCGQYRLYLNDGNGFFTDVTATHLPIGNVCANMDCIFGDIDGDFDLDVKTASTGSNNSRLYRNDGAGVFSLVTTIPGDSSCYSYDFGDINGDGDLDLIGINAGSGSTELLLENDGTGAFTNISSQISPNLSADDNDSKFFDYDNDGDLDLVIGRIFGAERVYNNDGNGNLTLVDDVMQSITDSTLDIMVADLTGNGKLDIVTAQGESGNFQNRIYINNGPADTIGPSIQRTEQAPDTADTNGPYVIRTVIYDSVTSDRGPFLDDVTLNYFIAIRAGLGGWQQVPMKWAGNSLWRGEIPGQPPDSTVAYYVTATDFASNTTTGPKLFFTVTCSGADVDCNGIINIFDLLALLAAWGPCPDPCPPSCSADLNSDCTVGILDLLTLLANWG